MSSVNKVIIVGRVGRDPESRTTQGGQTIVNMTVATSERWKDKSGNRQERTEWHKVVIFSEGLAKVASSYLKKGSNVYLEGQLQTRKWQNKDGQDQYSTEIVLQGFNAALVMLDGPEKREEQQSYAPPSNAAYDDEIPFAIALALGVGFAATQFFANGGAQWIA